MSRTARMLLVVTPLGGLSATWRLTRVRQTSCRLISSLLALIIFLSLGARVHADSRVVAFAFDQSLDAVLRIEDRNKDGDTFDPGEVTRFIDDTIAPAQGIDNSQGLFPLGPHQLLATDNFAPDNIVRLFDQNRSGGAFDAGESTVFFDGSLPGGFTLTNPTNISRGPDEALYVIDNNTIDNVNPEAIYKLKDINGDGDVNDAGEVSTFFELSPAGSSQTTTFDVAFDAAGNGYVIDITDPNQIESVDIIESGGVGIQELIDSTDLLTNSGFVITTLAYKLDHDPVTDEIVIWGESIGGNNALLAIKDANGSGSISSSEIRTLWTGNSSGISPSPGTARDFQRLSDGSYVFGEQTIDEDRVFHAVDVNGDGDFLDAGETRLLHDGLTPGLVTNQLGAVAGIAVNSGDFDDNDSFECADVDALVAEIVAGTDNPAFDLTGDGLVDADDLAEWLYEAGGAELASDKVFLVGDATLDGTVNGADFLAWNANKFTSNPSWCSGDFNADGEINGADFLLWNLNKFQSADVPAVPEPRSLVLLSAILLLGAIPITRRNGVAATY